MKQQEKTLPNILLCLFMDIIGYASFVLPGLGEFSDIIWAPVSGFIFYKMFGGKFGVIGGIFDFIEEALPFTDFIPSFTIAWFTRYLSMGKKNSASLNRAA
ncbi:MAG: hypothetical protein ABI741_14730 [Ferruginibacter sp.]